MPSLKLPDSHSMPVIGLGTWQAAPNVVEAAVTAALAAGYRLIDTAYNYGNEEAIGRALKSWFETGGKREDIFITTKLPNWGNRPNDVEKYLSESLQKLGLTYVDLYLIHHPFGFLAPPPGAQPPELDVSTDHLAIWRAMEAQVTAGRARSIGVSNFNGQQVERIAANSTVPISNLQVELHVYLQQPDLVRHCRDLGVTITAYAPLGSPNARTHFTNKYGVQCTEDANPLQDPKVLEISERLKKTPAQVLLRFLIQLGVAVVPKSSSPERVVENFQVLDWELSSDDVTALKNLDHGEKGRIFDFLFFKGVENHPEYPFTKPS